MSKKPQLSDISGIGEAMEEKLREAGVKTVLSLSKADPKKLSEKVDGLGEKSAKDFVKQAQRLIGAPDKKEKPKAKKKEAKAEKPKAKKAEPEAKSAKAKKAAEKPKAKKKEAKAEKPKAKKKKPKKPEVPARVKAIDTRLLRISQLKKKQMPRFRHEQAHRWKRVSNSWRQVRGIDSATREKQKGRIAMVSAGYRTPKAVRDLHPSLYREVLIYRPADLEGLDPEIYAVRIGGTVGGRKRQEILAAAEEKEIYVLNPRVPEEIAEEDLFTDLDVEVD
jgi:large subunit ribosomal protein L32e